MTEQLISRLSKSRAVAQAQRLQALALQTWREKDRLMPVAREA